MPPVPFLEVEPKKGGSCASYVVGIHQEIEDHLMVSNLNSHVDLSQNREALNPIGIPNLKKV